MKVKLAFSLCGYAFDRPNARSVVRLARRYFNEPSEDDDAPSRQILIGKLIGEDKHGEAFAAALELGERLCTAAKPACLLCPLHSECGYALAAVTAKNKRGASRIISMDGGRLSTNGKRQPRTRPDPSLAGLPRNERGGL
jgi:adenine-specific DNA glycosylase